MVVDDSMTVRKVTANNLCGHGMAVSLVSFDALADSGSGARKSTHIVVLYPLPGLGAHDEGKDQAVARFIPSQATSHRSWISSSLMT